MNRLLIFFGAFILLAVLSGCDDHRAAQENNTYVPRAYEGTPLNVILLPEERASIVLERFMPIKYYLERSLNRALILRVPKDYQTAIEDIGKTDNVIAFLDPATYCEVKRKYKEGIVSIMKTYFREDNKPHSVLVAKESSPLSKAADAKGKRLALGSKDSSFSYLIPVSMLNDVNISMKDLAGVSYLQQEDRIALSILLGEHDIGGMSDSVAKKYLPDGLKIIKKSEPIPRLVVAASSDMDKQDLTSIINALSALQDRGTLASIDRSIAGFISAEDRDFDVIRAMIFNLTGKDYREYGKNVIKVAVLPLYSAITIYERYDPLMRYLSQKTGYEFKLYIPRDFEDFVRVIKSGSIDFSYQNPYIYSLIDKDYNLKPLVTTIGEDNDKQYESTTGDMFRGVIITRDDSSIKDIRDLRGKKVLITSPKSAGGYLSQKIYLKQRGIDIERDMILVDAKRQENVITGVYRGEADAGFIRESALVVWKDAVNMQRIKVLTPTAELPNWPFTASRDVPPQLAMRVKNLLVELSDEAILGAARIKGFKPASEEFFRKIGQH